MIKVRLVVIALLVILVYSVLFSFLYNYYVVGKIDEFDQKFKNARGGVAIVLPEKDTYFIKIWGIYFPKRVYFNNREVFPFMTRERGGLKEVSIKVEADLAKEGPNFLIIASDGEYSVKVRNFYGVTGSRAIYILFNTSKLCKFSLENFVWVIFVAYLFTILVWSIFCFIMQIIFSNFNLPRFFNYLYKVILGIFVFFYLFILASSFTSYRVVLTPTAFLSLFVFLCFMSTLILFIIFMVKYRKQLTLGPKFIRFIQHYLKICTDISQNANLDFYLDRFIMCFKQAPHKYLVACFIFLLFICLFFSLLKLYSIANLISYFAYFCLVAGLGVQLIRVIKENR